MSNDLVLTIHPTFGVLAKAPRRNRTHRIHRNTPVDHHRSNSLKAGISADHHQPRLRRPRAPSGDALRYASRLRASPPGALSHSNNGGQYWTRNRGHGSKRIDTSWGVRLYWPSCHGITTDLMDVMSRALWPRAACVSSRGNRCVMTAPRLTCREAARAIARG